MPCTFSSNSVVKEVELCECLQKMQKSSLIEMKKYIKCYSIVFQCFTKMLGTVISNSIDTELEFCECLHRI